MLIERAEEKKNMLVRTCKELHSVCSGALSAGKMQTKDSLTHFPRKEKKKKEEGERNGCEFFPASDDGKDVKRWMRGKSGE